MGLIKRIARRFGLGSREFEAAKQSRLTSGWLTNPHVTIDADLRKSFTKLVGRARDLSVNDDYVRRFLKLCKSNIIGPNGILMQSDCKDDDLSKDESACMALEDAWQDWGKHGSPEVSGRFSWVGIQHNIVQSLFRDGEFLAVHRDAKGINNWGYALQLLDPLSLDPELQVDLKDTLIRMGIELDADTMRPVAYHLKVNGNVVDGDTWIHRGNTYRRLPAERVLHGFFPEFAIQTRGFTPMCSGMMRLKQLDGFAEAAVIAARLNASVMGFFTKNDDGLGYGGDDQDAIGNLIMDVKPGTFEQLPNGVSLDMFDPKQPAPEFAAFVKATLRGVSAGLGVSYNSLANDLEGVNFSSIRAGVLEDREEWKLIQGFIISAFCQRVFEKWLRTAIVAGIPLPTGGKLDMQREQRYRKVRWQGRRWGWVDPLKEVRSNIEAIEQNLTTASAVIREQGGDPETVFAERAREKQRMEELGITPAEVLAPLAVSEAKPNEQDETDEKD